MGIWNQIAQYLFIRKKDSKEKPGFNLRLMHGMNRISIFVFLLALLFLLVKWLVHVL